MSTADRRRARQRMLRRYKIPKHMNLTVAQRIEAERVLATRAAATKRKRKPGAG